MTDPEPLPKQRGSTIGGSGIPGGGEGGIASGVWATLQNPERK